MEIAAIDKWLEACEKPIEDLKRLVPTAAEAFQKTIHMCRAQDKALKLALKSTMLLKAENEQLRTKLASLSS